MRFSLLHIVILSQLLTIHTVPWSTAHQTPKQAKRELTLSHDYDGDDEDEDNNNDGGWSFPFGSKDKKEKRRAQRNRDHEAFIASDKPPKSTPGMSLQGPDDETHVLFLAPMRDSMDDVDVRPPSRSGTPGPPPPLPASLENAKHPSIITPPGPPPPLVQDASLHRNDSDAQSVRSRKSLEALPVALRPGGLGDGSLMAGRATPEQYAP